MTKERVARVYSIGNRWGEDIKKYIGIRPISQLEIRERNEILRKGRVVTDAGGLHPFAWGAKLWELI